MEAAILTVCIRKRWFKKEKKKNPFSVMTSAANARAGGWGFARKANPGPPAGRVMEAIN